MTANFFQRDLGLQHVHHLHEAAHVGALVFVGQIHEHVDGGHGVLEPVASVAHADGITQVLDAHLVDRDVAKIPVVLNVPHAHFSKYSGFTWRMAWKILPLICDCCDRVAGGDL